jgi:predicted AlkP superfamily pyrophosphatase or phosphodiesterase
VAPAGRTRLVLILAVDMLSTRDLLRFQPAFHGGLARLLKEGAFFEEAYHQHALTLTSPGHATLMTGLHPSHHGVIANQWLDGDTGEAVYSVADPKHGRSPRNLLGTTLGDWLKKLEPRSRVYSASGKDRAAILMGGHEADGSYWYDRETGRFVSSSYYPRPAPGWLEAFNDERIPDEFFGRAWEPLPVDDGLLPALGLVELDGGAFETDRFPHALGRSALQPDPDFHADFYGSPFVDEYLARLARRLVTEEDLGAAGRLDVLALSFSAADAVGHVHGPDSREYLDVLLRLDRSLGELFDFLQERVGWKNVLVALSSDHGVQPLPEVSRMRGAEGWRQRYEDVLCVQQAGRRLDELFGDEDWLVGGFYLDRDTLERRDVSRARVEAELKRALEECEAVAAVWTRAELEARADTSDPHARLYINSFRAGRSADLLMQPKPFFLARYGGGTTHGSPYAYDAHVPMVIAGAGVRAGGIEERVHTVDLAPTLAGWLGLPVPPHLDGIDRSDLLRP